MKHLLSTCAMLLVVASTVPTLVGCSVPSGSLPSGAGNGGGGDNGGGTGGDTGDGTGGAADNTGGDTGGSTDGGGDGMGSAVDPVSGEYDPTASLTLETTGLTLVVPSGATLTSTTVTILPASEVPSPGAIPGAVDLAGGQFGPDGLQFLLPVDVTVSLLAPTAATALPVLTFNETLKRWVGTGDLGTVTPTGDEVSFPLSHFSLAGVPDPFPVPLGGDAITDLVTIPNTGQFFSTEISTDTASLTYSSSVGGSLEIDVQQNTVNDAGQPQVVFMHLSAVRVTLVNQFVIAEIGGTGSVFDDGDFRSADEPVVGTVAMAISGSIVNVTVFVASPARVIFGTLTGEAG